MESKNLIESTQDLYTKALDTMKRKNSDYSGSNNSMKNFEISAVIAGVTVPQGILTRLTDKVSRIGNLLNNKTAQVTDETIFDTIQDLINYAAILHYSLQERQK